MTDLLRLIELQNNQATVGRLEFLLALAFIYIWYQHLRAKILEEKINVAIARSRKARSQNKN